MPIWRKRVAQAPSPDQQPPAGDPAPTGDGAPAPVPDPAPAPTPTDQAPPPAPEQAPAPAPEPAPPPPAAQPNVPDTPNLTEEELLKLSEAEAKEEIITVTGSTIERKTLTTAAPVTILTKNDLNAAGRATVGDIIQQLPAQTNAINAQVNNGGDGSTRVDLRGLGTARTLVLVNGRRVAPGGLGANASVDLNAIPLAMIERVEVLKDGASAVYGSDAIGGVVNIITRSDFEGTEVNIYTGGSQRGDGLTYDASFVTGHTSQNKRGNIVFSAGFQSQHPVFAGDRVYSDHDRTFNFMTKEKSDSGSTAVPNGRVNTTLTDTNGDGRADPGFNLCGVGVVFCTRDEQNPTIWRPFVAPADLYNFQPDNYLYTPSSRYNVYSAGTYKITKDVEAFFEGSFLNRRSDQQLAPEPFVAATTISKDSMYNDLGVDVLDLRRRLEEFGPRGSLQNIDTFQMVTGVQGKISEDSPALKNWKWELSYNYGRTDGIERNQGNLILSRLSNALGPSMPDANGKPICVTTPGDAKTAIPGCVPMNILGASGSIDQDSINYVTFTGISNGFNEQQTALAQTHGRISKLPNGGDISLAVGADYRYAAGGFTPDPLTSTGDTTGNAAAPTDGSYNVAEGYGELSIVPISGKKYAQWAELNLAARAFRYNTFGSGVTWKAGGLFRTTQGLAVRGTYSTAFRAPSIGELFRGPADDNPAAVDPCDTTPPTAGGKTIVLDPVVAQHCREQGVPDNSSFGTAQQRQIIGGNPELEAETAKVITAGVVYEPPQAKGLSFTVDYWRINIDDAIQTLGANVIMSNCYVRGQQNFCDQIHRDMNLGGQIDFIDNPVSNVGGTKTTGMDFAVAYDRSFGKIGRLREKFEAQRLFIYDLDNTQSIIHGRGVYDLGVYPLWKWNFSTLWQHPRGFGGGLNVRYVGDFNECNANDCNSGQTSRNVDRYFKGDVYGSYNLKSPAGTTTISAGVNNVLDAKPSVIFIGFAGDSDAATYDYMGRFFYARLSQLF